MLGILLAAGLVVFLGMGPSDAGQNRLAGFPQLQELMVGAPAAVAEAPRPGRRVARAFAGGSQSRWSGFVSKLRRAGRNIGQTSRPGVIQAFAGGSQKNRFAVLRSASDNSAGSTTIACGGMSVHRCDDPNK